MKQEALIQMISDAFGVSPDCPWESGTEALVFRHAGSRKWFALWMRVKNASLGLPGDGVSEVLNVKCDPILIGSLAREPGYLPAYHMNKGQWLTILLDRVPQDDILALISMSYRLTGARKKK